MESGRLDWSETKFRMMRSKKVELNALQSKSTKEPKKEYPPRKKLRMVL